MNLIIFGPQGSGKGTQADMLAEKFDLSHIETGQIFRDMGRGDTELGKIVKKFDDQKEMVPDDITVTTLQECLKKISIEKGVILDSAPRTIGQIDPVEKLMKADGRSIDKAIYIRLPYDESVARITKRYLCTVCLNHIVLGKHIQSQHDICPICGGLITQRGDDTPDGIAKRLKTFYEVTVPVISHYRDKGILIEVDGNRTMEAVFEDIIRQI